jgi:CRP/FNR family cyclic AMP-dependent transcriptional regulator
MTWSTNHQANRIIAKVLQRKRRQVQSTAIAGVLGKTALFGALSQADRLLVAGRLRTVTFKTGQTIFARGDAGKEIFIVAEGRVRLAVLSPEGRALAFKLAGPGDMFGEVAVLDGGPRSADAVALTRVVALTLSQTRVEQLLASNTRISRAAISYLCSRLRQTSEQAEAIALHSIEARIARYLLARLKVRDAANETAKINIDLGLTQGELASLIGASRQKVNAALAALEAVGALKRTGKQIACNPGQLVRVASPGDSEN